MQISNIRRIIYLIMIIVLIMTITSCKRKNADDGALEVHNSVQDESVMPDQGGDSLNVVPVNATPEPETEPVIETETTTEPTTIEPTTVPPTTTAAPTTTVQETTTVPPTTIAPTTEAPTVPATTVPPTTKQEATVPPTTAAPPTTVAPTTEAVTVPPTTVPVATEAPTVASNMTSDGSDADPNYVVNDRNYDSAPPMAETWPSWSNEFYQQGDPEGFTRERRGGQLYDSEGYGTEGYNKDGFNREGVHWTQVKKGNLTEEGKNTFDQNRKDK